MEEGTRIAVWSADGAVRYGTVRGFAGSGCERKCLALMDDGFLAAIDEALASPVKEGAFKSRFGEQEEDADV